MLFLCPHGLDGNVWVAAVARPGLGSCWGCDFGCGYGVSCRGWLGTWRGLSGAAGGAVGSNSDALIDMLDPLSSNIVLGNFVNE